MTFKRLMACIKINLIKDGRGRAKWLKEHKYFADMGENCFWQPRVIPADPKLIKLHDNVVVASEVLFVNHDVMHFVFRELEPNFEFPTNYGAIEIGNNVFIGSRCVILPNTKIEDNVIIGAGAVVTGRLSKGGVYAGVPAKRIGNFDDIMKSRECMVGEKTRKERFEKVWNDFDKKLR